MPETKTDSELVAETEHRGAREVEEHGHWDPETRSFRFHRHGEARAA
ncbi:MAG: hypothetical protein M3024_14015 [Candidatus Dormibacteraeota bacterium]|nr:hypothetical protein [Candidatus Dormibacteraeota bacterium]